MATAVKLSDAQIKALNEVNELGFTNARKNTRDSVAKYFTATEDGQALKLNQDGRDALGLPVEEEWQDAPSVTTDEEEFKAIIEKNNLMAQWRGSDLWADLSLEEIKEDIDTAFPINRKARREHYRNLRNAFRRKNVSRPRKALKITGKVGV